jgi:glyoxylase-like metal-dependent hydrolase (beta-lactamase superfamily II)
MFTIYFINDNGNAALIEPGPAALVPAIQTALKDLRIGNLQYIIPTHIHLDHGSAIGRLSQLYPTAKVIVNSKAVRHVIDPARLIAGTKVAFGDDYTDTYGEILPVAEKQVMVVEDNDSISLGSRKLVFINTPGHAPHHISIFDTKTGGLFCGEALGLIYGEGTPPLPAVAAPSLDIDTYVANMKRLRALNPHLLFYSHGGMGTDADNLISSAVENTRAIGDIILGLLEAGKSEEAIISGTGDYIRERYGVVMDDFDLASNVRGYIYYFKNHQL